MSSKSKKTKVKYYRLEQLENETQLDNPFDESGVEIRGDINKHVVVSVPIDMTHSAVSDLAIALKDAWGNKPIILTTNNIKFLRAKLIEKKDVGCG